MTATSLQLRQSKTSAFGALLLRAARHAEGDRLVGQDAGDEQLSAFEEHVCTTTAWRRSGATVSTLHPANVEPFG